MHNFRTPFSKPGYNPRKDPNIEKVLDKIKGSFVGPSAKTKFQPKVSDSHGYHLTCAITYKKAVNERRGKYGVEMPKDTAINVTFRIYGSGSKVVRGRMALRTVIIDPHELYLTESGKKLVQIKSITISGGRVWVSSAAPAGKVKKYAKIERAYAPLPH